MTIGNSLSGFRIASVEIQLHFSSKLRDEAPYLQLVTNYLTGGLIFNVDTDMSLAYNPLTETGAMCCTRSATIARRDRFSV